MSRVAVAWSGLWANDPTASAAGAGHSRGIRYIGSKARVAAAILDRIGGRSESDGFFVDALAGTGVVAGEAASRGWPVRLNDHLYCAVVMSSARLLAHADVQFDQLGGYTRAIDVLNHAKPVEGFIYNEYSPASERPGRPRRMYFTEPNAARIDGMRGLVAEWARSGTISRTEEQLLIADLLGAANRVANIAGTYGCFLAYWLPTTSEAIVLAPRRLRNEPVKVETFNNDVFEVPIGPADIAYFDPPYTKRQYAAYYHILETIAVGDSPEVRGVTGLRPWRHKLSVFCYRKHALRALRDLVSQTGARRTFLSYSSEGHVELDELAKAMRSLGTVRVHELAAVGRYRPNRAARNAGSLVSEYLIEVTKPNASERDSIR